MNSGKKFKNKQRNDDELEKFYHNIWDAKYKVYLDCKKNNRPYNQPKVYNCHCEVEDLPCDECEDCKEVINTLRNPTKTIQTNSNEDLCQEFKSFVESEDCENLPQRENLTTRSGRKIKRKKVIDV